MANVYYRIINFTTYGGLGIHRNVLEDIIRITLREMDEVVIPDEQKFFPFRKRSIKCDVLMTTNDVFVYLTIGVKYGHNISKTSELIQQLIENAMLAMLDIRPKKIFIKIIDIK